MVRKTTLIRMLAGLLKPDAGEIKILGMDPQKQRLMLEYPRLYATKIWFI